MKVIGYTRVSTEKQGVDGVSLDNQKAKIEAYCTVKDWNLASVITDEDSAKNLRRSGIKRLMQMITDHEVDVLIVNKLDRLTRSVRDLGTLLDLINKHGVSLVSLSETIDTTTAAGELMLNVLISVSQWERKVISERTTEAMQYLKKSGKAYCRATFSDKDVIQKIRDMRAGGLSLQDIATNLTDAGVKTARGGQWHASTVLSVLNTNK
jgi:site-specific DNA recombinase